VKNRATPEPGEMDCTDARCCSQIENNFANQACAAPFFPPATP
jgi:hypothetical protein